MVGWNLRRQKIACAVCASAFADRARYFSLLSARGGELARLDFCEACWAGRAAAAAESPPGGPPGETGSDDLLWWRTRHVEQKRKGLSLNLEALEALFLALEGRSERGIQEMRFLLCLVLMRKRRLKIVRLGRADGAETFLVRRPRRQEELTVVVHEFTPERIAALREELRALFAGEAGAAELAASHPDAL